MSSNGIYDVLHGIQVALKVPKDQWNDFGKFKYRTAEGILQAVKELLPDGYVLLVDVNPEVMNGKLVCRVTASIGNGTESVSTTAYAVEPESKKGMDASQLSGATISFAKKYALANLFAIDGSEDNDAPEKEDEEPETAAEPEIGQESADSMKAMKEKMAETCARYDLALVGRGAEPMGKRAIAAMCAKELGKNVKDWTVYDYRKAIGRLEEEIDDGRA